MENILLLPSQFRNVRSEFILKFPSITRLWLNRHGRFTRGGRELSYSELLWRNRPPIVGVPIEQRKHLLSFNWVIVTESKKFRDRFSAKPTFFGGLEKEKKIF